jgi:hypothetical protein
MWLAQVLLEQQLVEGCSSPTQLLDWSRWRRPPANRLATFVPPRLPAVEVQKRLQRDPETARRWALWLLLIADGLLSVPGRAAAACWGVRSVWLLGVLARAGEGMGWELCLDVLWLRDRGERMLHVPRKQLGLEAPPESAAHAVPATPSIKIPSNLVP